MSKALTDDTVTKREYFAAMAMQGLLASWTSNYQPPLPSEKMIPEIIGLSLLFSDELLKQLQ